MSKLVTYLQTLYYTGFHTSTKSVVGVTRCLQLLPKFLVALGQGM